MTEANYLPKTHSRSALSWNCVSVRSLILAFPLWLASGSTCLLAQAQVAQLRANPRSVLITDQPKMITVSARVMSAPFPSTLVAGQYLNQGNGRLLPLVPLRDDGLNGDETRGDGVFSGQFLLNEKSTGVFTWGVSAVYAGQAEPKLFAGPAIFVKIEQTCEQALLEIAAALDSANFSEFSRYFANRDNDAVLRALTPAMRAQLAKDFRNARRTASNDDQCQFSMPATDPTTQDDESLLLVSDQLGVWRISSW